MSGDPEQEYFADGVVEDIITALSRVQHCFSSSLATRASPTRVGQLMCSRSGANLGVRYVLEGSVRKAGTDPHHWSANRLRDGTPLMG